MNRAYVALDIKAVSDDARRIEGWATVPAMDRVGDVVVPRGAIYELPLPFLLDHDHSKAVGEVDSVEVTDKGIKFSAHIKKIDEPGEVKDLCDKAWALIKNGLRKAVSIGFAAKDFDILPSGGLKFTAWEWLELSAVTVPAAPGAKITNIKSISAGDRFETAPLDSPNPNVKQPAASGHKAAVTVRLITPPASGKSNSKTPQEGNDVKTVSEQIAALEAKRAATAASMQDLMQKSIEAGETLDKEGQESFDSAQAEIDAIDGQLKRLKAMESILAKSAKPVAAVDNGSAPLASTPGVSVKAPEKPEPGIRFARYVRCMAIAHKDHVDAARLAENLYGERDPVVVGMVKAAGTAVGAYNSTTDSALIGNEGGFADFAELLRNRSIVGRFGQNGIPALRGIPFRVPLISQVTSGGAYWVGEGDGKPVVKGTFGRTELAPLKIAAISVATMEVLRDSSPGSERLIRDDLAASIVERMDLSFIDPTNNGSAGVFPASITYGAEAIVSETYSDADDIRTDVRSLMQKFINAKNPLTTGVWVMSASNALALSMIKNALGQAEFPAITINGGMFEGLPVIVSDHIGSYVALVNASDIWFGDEGGIKIDMSDQASLQMVGGDDDGSTQNSITPVATSMMSLWQTNSVGIRAERTLNWLRRRTSAVAYLSSVAWGGAVNES